ncbi:MAG: hypothetical protein NTU93_07940 [Arthrobacter sp.]|nr:hypothetical protein [Arthrobacter sp.]
MRRAWIVLALAAMPLAVGGCAGSEAAQQGFDLQESLIAQVETAGGEWHGLRTVQIDSTEDAAVAAFAADLVAAGQDKPAVAAKVVEFQTAQRTLRAERATEDGRAKTYAANIQTLRESTSALRSLNELRLGWKPYIVEYTARLRALAQKGAVK